MNNAPQKILAGIGVVTLLGCAALGFVIYKKAGERAEARQAFEQTAQNYQRLRTQPLYPNSENLKKLEEQRTVAAEAAEAALKELSPLSIPLEPITPEQFQEKLREMVNAVAAKAEERKVELPADFYFGFDRYRTQAPSTNAAPALWRQARVIELAVNILLDSRIDSLTALQRTDLPEEGGKAAGNSLVSSYPFVLNFKAAQASFRRALNEITSSKTQFFIPRSLVVKNENDKPIAKAAPAAPNPGEAAETEEADASGATAASRAALQYVVGMEKLNVTLNLEMVVFADSFAK